MMFDARVSLDRAKPGKLPITLFPLVDVILVLILFFMLSNAFREVSAFRVAPADMQSQPAMLLRLTDQGRLIYNGHTADLPELRRLIRDLRGPTPRIMVALLPSAGATNQDLVSALDLIRAAGVSQVELLQIEGSQ